jgi:hypothetical protein
VAEGCGHHNAAARRPPRRLQDPPANQELRTLPSGYFAEPKHAAKAYSDDDLGTLLGPLVAPQRALGDWAATRGMASTLEMCPALTINTLGAAVAAVRHVGRRDFSLLLDTMHLGRSGATAAEVAALDPALIGYVQLCDAPRTPREPNYLQEATLERMVPGEGEMRLRDYLEVLPPGLTISLEVPSRSLAEAGIGPEIRLRCCVEAARRLLAEAEVTDARVGTEGQIDHEQ